MNVIYPYRYDKGIKTITPPSVIGTATYGATLTRINGTYASYHPITITGNWQRDGVDIIGETGATYTLVDADAGKTISWRETASNIHLSVNTNSNNVNTLYFALSTATTTLTNIRIKTVSNNSFTVYFGDGTINTYASNTTVNYTYGSPYVGNVIIETAAGLTDISLVESSSPNVYWNFNLSVFAGMINLSVVHFNGNNITITGNIIHLSNVTTTVYFHGNNMTINGDIIHLSNVTNTVHFNGNNITVNGDIIHLSNVTYWVWFSGSNMTINGDISYLANVTNRIWFSGSNIELTYTSTTWVKSPTVSFSLNLKVGFIATSTEIDNLCIDLAAGLDGTQSGATYDFRYNNAPVTAASLTARNQIIAAGVNLLVNT